MEQPSIISPMNIVPDIPKIGYELRTLSSTSSEYAVVRQKFKSTGKSYMTINTIRSVFNPIQKALYELKKQEALETYGCASSVEADLFHGTKTKHLDSICKNNLDRRLCCLHKFGHGVSFTPISYYASHYCDTHVADKVMLLCKVITLRGSLGTESTKVPPPGCDHTKNNAKGDVIVKYDDNSYYPEYVINFAVPTDSDNDFFEDDSDSAEADIFFW